MEWMTLKPLISSPYIGKHHPTWEMYIRNVDGKDLLVNVLLQRCISYQTAALWIVRRVDKVWDFEVLFTYHTDPQFYMVGSITQDPRGSHPVSYVMDLPENKLLYRYGPIYICGSYVWYEGKVSPFPGVGNFDGIVIRKNALGEYQAAIASTKIEKIILSSPQRSQLLMLIMVLRRLGIIIPKDIVTLIVSYFDIEVDLETGKGCTIC